MKDLLHIVGTVNPLSGGRVSTNWATLKFDEVLLMLNTAALTCMGTLSAMTTLDDSLPRTSETGQEPGFDLISNGDEKNHTVTAQREDIYYENIGLPSKPGGSLSAQSYRLTLLLAASVFF